MKFFLVAIPVFFLSACGLLSSDDKAPSGKSEAWEYEYIENGCSTGKISGSTNSQQCEALKDDARNNFCAKTTRENAFKEICDNGASNPSTSETSPKNPDTPVSRKEVCGYDFEPISDSLAVRGVLSGTWLTRKRGILSENGPGETRSYKDGFFFDFSGGEIAPVRIYHKLNGADLDPTAISIPNQATEITVSAAVSSGIYAGWHLIQWKTGNNRCSTIAVGFERRNNELADTLLILGPKSFFGVGDVETPGIEEFFKEPGMKRDYLPLGMTSLPRWKQYGL